jgi:RNA-binding protein YlmH
MDTKGIHVHFHPDEREFVDRVTDWVEQVADKHIVKQTDFLDPRQQHILDMLVRRNSLCHSKVDGGQPATERKRALIGRDYLDLEQEPAQVSLLEIRSDDIKFRDLQHGDFLGALLGLGIKRGKVGDIHYHADKAVCHVFVAAEIAEFIRLQLSQVHKVHVLTEIVASEKFESADKLLEEQVLSVASLRLDGIVSDVIRLSRAKTLPPIKAGRCRVNWRVVEDPSYLLKAGDVVSLQGFGRFEVLEVVGQSKSGRFRLRVGKYR